jgi:hypothetical protein
LLRVVDRGQKYSIDHVVFDPNVYQLIVVLLCKQS